MSKRDIGLTKKFSGKTYKRIPMKYTKKKSASNVAQTKRKQGNNARIRKVKLSNRRKPVYAVYYRKK